jgi:hypothetical protein
MYKIKLASGKFLTNKNKRVQHYPTKDVANNKITSLKLRGARIVDAGKNKLVVTGNTVESVPRKMSRTKMLSWVEGTLVNDETGSDREMREHFMRYGPMSEVEADYYISQRAVALRDPIHFVFIPYKTLLSKKYYQEKAGVDMHRRPLPDDYTPVPRKDKHVRFITNPKYRRN